MTMTPLDPARAAAPDPWLSAVDSAKHMAVCRATFWADVKAGRIPPGYYLAPRRPRWRLSDINAAVAFAGRKGAGVVQVAA